MNYLDIVIILPLCWGVFKGIKNGLIIEAATLIALGAGVYGAILFSEQVAVWLNVSGRIEESYLPIIAFAATFIVIVVLIHIIAFVLDKLIKSIALGLPNRIAGGVFGLIKFTVIVCAFLLLIEKFNAVFQFLDPVLTQQSLLYYPLLSVANFVYSALPF
jgi:membrane protein required for colicin V production